MIEVDRSESLWVVTLNRPEKANSLTEAMLRDLVQVMQDAHSARGIILTGKGKVFSAGADIEAARAGLATSPLWEQLSSAIAKQPGITIAALNGTLAGGAFGMALACDIRLAAPEAKFFYPVMKLGFLPQPSDPVRLSALIGPARAKLILMGAQKLNATDALSFGLIERIVPPEQIVDEARAIASDAIAAPFEIALQIKEMCGRS